MLKSDFIPVAIDQAYQRRQQDTEGDFYRKIASQGPRSNFAATTQGFYLATPSGKLLLYNNNRDPQKVRRLMKEKLSEFKKTDETKLKTDPIVAKTRDARWDLHPPTGGMVVRVHGKILDGYQTTDDRWKQIFQNALSRDNMWISANERKAIAKGKLPEAVARRLARFHLVDGTRGEPLMWRDNEVTYLKFDLNDGAIVGKVHIQSEDGSRGYQAELKGFVESQGDNVTRFDIVALGKCWGDGPYTKGGPKGKFPLALSFSLADGNDIADAVPPQGCKGWLAGYMVTAKDKEEE